MRESAIQSRIVTKLRTDGWFVTKLLQTTTNGIPDLLCIKDGRVVFIEVKRPGGRVTELQKLRHQQLSQAGVEVIVTQNVIDL